MPDTDDSEGSDSAPLPQPHLTPAERWLSRLSFSFLIIAAWLIWTAFHQANGLPGATGWRSVVYLCGAGASVALGLMGIRVRHRHGE